MFELKFYLTYKRGCESRDFRKYFSARFRSIVKVGRDVLVAAFTHISSEIRVGIGCTRCIRRHRLQWNLRKLQVCTYRIFSRPRLFSIGLIVVIVIFFLDYTIIV